MTKPISACLILLGAMSAAHAAPADTTDTADLKAAAPESATMLPQVTISGSRASDMDERRQSTAGKQVYGREELDRNGDSSLGEVLKRLPGVTLGGRPGRGGEIRMRGLGSGYTQVLLNGERPPAGFSMDSLSPDQVERVEVMRGPVAEHSTRAIAGTINIVLRDGYQQRDTQLKLSDALETGLHSYNLALAVPGKRDGLTYLLSGSAYDSHQQDRSFTHNLDTDSAGQIRKDQLLEDSSARHARGVHLAPRLSYRFEDGDTLNFQPFLMSGSSDGSGAGTLDQRTGPGAPEYTRYASNSHASNTFARGFGNWVHKLPGAAKLDIKFGAGRGQSDSNSTRLQYDAGGALLDRLLDSDATRERSASTGGKYTTPLGGGGHLLAAGWEAEWLHREQSRVSLDNGQPQFAESGDNLTAATRRYAAYAQDEWDIDAQWSVYAGLRWEGIRTTSSRAGSGSGSDIVNDSGVWSPLLHSVWRLPGSEKDQIRMSLTNSYRAPSLSDLIALPSLSRLNSATRPDRIGNPALKPELARGLDLAYEHYLGRGGIVSVSGFVREIDQLMRRVTTLQDNGRWLSAPANLGHARTSGLELEAKLKLADLIGNAPALDLRANYSRFWSRVDGIPGPNNRLDQQASQTANLGFDYRLKDLPLTVGGSFNWTPATTIQTSPTEIVEGAAKRVLDLYALWKFDARTQLRVAAANLLRDDYDSARVVYADGLAQSADTRSRTYAVLTVKLETKF